jgi:hypothetical protein
MNPITRSLPEMATQINEAHEKCVQSVSMALEHARQAGELLQQAKDVLAHGQWLPWLKANCPFSERVAQNYMRVAREWPTIQQAKTNRGADLTYRQAIHLLTHSENDATKLETPTCTPIPELRADRVYTACDGQGSMAEITPIPDHPGYFYVAVFLDIDTDAASVEYTRRGVLLDESTWNSVLNAFEFTPAGAWSDSPFDGTEPWYITDPGKPAPVRRASSIRARIA